MYLGVKICVWSYKAVSGCCRYRVDDLESRLGLRIVKAVTLERNLSSSSCFLDPVQQLTTYQPKSPNISVKSSPAPVRSRHLDSRLGVGERGGSLSHGPWWRQPWNQALEQNWEPVGARLWYLRGTYRIRILLGHIRHDIICIADCLLGSPLWKIEV